MLQVWHLFAHAITLASLAFVCACPNCCNVSYRVKAMEVDERPTEQYSDIGGLDKQIQELIEAVVLPVTHKERFENLGGCLVVGKEEGGGWGLLPAGRGGRILPAGREGRILPAGRVGGRREGNIAYL